MGVNSDQPSPQPFQIPANPVGPGSIGGPAGIGGPGGLGGSKQLKIRQMANAAKQRGAQQVARLKQMTSGVQHSAPMPATPNMVTSAEQTLVNRRDMIDRFIHKVIFG